MPVYTPSRISGATKVGVIPWERPEKKGWQFVPQGASPGGGAPDLFFIR